MKLKLISFSRCPYVQRAIIALREKHAEHETVFIDLANKPDWFLAISPRGKVPVLVVDDTPVFESQAICELLDEIGPPPRLMPVDPIERARDRGWFAFAEDILFALYRIQLSTEQAAYEKAGADLGAALRRLETELAGRTWLSGDGRSFGMADVALAPACARIGFLQRIGAYRLPDGLSAVQAWIARIEARESVRGSLPADFDELSLQGMRDKGAVALGAGARASG